MRGLEHWNEIIDNHPVLTVEEEVALARQRDEGGRRGAEALDKLILHNLRAVVQRVEMMNCKPDLKHDLMSAGVLKLRHAATKWTPMEGRRFFHYAFMWIREGVTKEAKKFWHDDTSLDAEYDDGNDRELLVGSAEDDHAFLDSNSLDGLTEREKIIIKIKCVDFNERPDYKIAEELKIKEKSVPLILKSAIKKLLKKAA